MWLMAFCALSIGQAPETPSEARLGLAGTWTLLADDKPGELVLRIGKGDAIEGSIFGEPIVGTYDPETSRLVIKRQQVTKAGELAPIQVYSGVMARVEDAKTPRLSLEGTFKSVAGADWGEPDVEYPWKATWKSEATGPPTRAEQLVTMQGRWDVVEAQTSAGITNKLPEATGLVRKGSRLTIRGNELIRDDKVIATLANDLSMPGPVEDFGARQRRPLMLTLPTGKGMLISYVFHGDDMEITFPLAFGNVGAGQLIYLRRPAK